MFSSMNVHKPWGRARSAPYAAEMTKFKGPCRTVMYVHASSATRMNRDVLPLQAPEGVPYIPLRGDAMVYSSTENT